MELLSQHDLYARGRRYLLTRARRIEPEVVDTDGSDANIFIGSTSAIGTAISTQLRVGLGELFYTSARGDKLDRLVLDRTDGELPRKGGSFARVSVTFRRPTAAGGDGTIPVGTVLTTLNGFEYITLEAVSFSGGGLVGTARTRATVAGKEPQVGRNMIRNYAKPATIFDQSITLNNDEPAAGGEAPEEDGLYIERARAFARARIRGTLRAIETGALTVDGVVSARAQEALADGHPARVVTLHAADSSGVSNAAMVADIQDALMEWRAAGIAVLVQTGLPQLVVVRLRLSFSANASGNTANLATLVRDAIVEYVNSLGAGQMLTRAGLYSVLSRYAKLGLVVSEQTLVEPVGDIIPAPGRTLRMRLEDCQLV